MTVRNDAKMGDRLQFAVSSRLKRSLESKAAALGLDVPAAARVAIALFVEKGIDYAKNPPAGTGSAAGG